MCGCICVGCGGGCVCVVCGWGVLSALAERTNRDRLICPLLLLLSFVSTTLSSTSSACFNGFQPKLKSGHTCNMGTLVCWCSQRSHIKVKGHLRSSCKADYGKVASFEMLKSDWNQTCLIDRVWDLMYTHVVRGHIPRSMVIRGQVVRLTQNVNFTSFKKLKSDWNIKLGLLILFGNLHMVIGQRSQIKVKGHVRSSCNLLENVRYICLFTN